LKGVCKSAKVAIRGKGQHDQFRNRGEIIMRRGFVPPNPIRLISMSLIAVALLISPARSEFTVFLSDKAPHQNPQRKKLDGNLPREGKLYVYGYGDTQLSQISLDIILKGGDTAPFKFTSADTTINNPGNRWSFLDGPLIVMNNSVTNFGGLAIPPGASGIGGTVPEEVPGVGFLLGELGYVGTRVSGGDSGIIGNLELRVGSNLIADYDSNAVFVRLGGPSNPLVNGTMQGSAGDAGYVFLIPEPSSVAFAVPVVWGLLSFRRPRIS
jgi:hypothetical protein